MPSLRTLSLRSSSVSLGKGAQGGRGCRDMGDGVSVWRRRGMGEDRGWSDVGQEGLMGVSVAATGKVEYRGRSGAAE